MREQVNGAHVRPGSGVARHAHQYREDQIARKRYTPGQGRLRCDRAGCFDDECPVCQGEYAKPIQGGLWG